MTEPPDGGIVVGILYDGEMHDVVCFPVGAQGEILVPQWNRWKLISGVGRDFGHQIIPPDLYGGRWIRRLRPVGDPKVEVKLANGTLFDLSEFAEDTHESIARSIKARGGRVPTEMRSASVLRSLRLGISKKFDATRAMDAAFKQVAGEGVKITGHTIAWLGQREMDNLAAFKAASDAFFYAVDGQAVLTGIKVSGGENSNYRRTVPLSKKAHTKEEETQGMLTIKVAAAGLPAPKFSIEQDDNGQMIFKNTGTAALLFAYDQTRVLDGETLLSSRSVLLPGASTFYNGASGTNQTRETITLSLCSVSKPTDEDGD